MCDVTLSVVVLDPSCEPVSARQWAGGAGWSTRLRIGGHQSGPALASWLRDSDSHDAIVLHRLTEARQAAYLANVLSGAVPGSAVATVTVTTSLLAAAVVAVDACESSDERPSTTVSRIERTLAGSVSGLWTRTVTRLSNPSPSFGQHVRSIFPGGTGFVSLRGEGARVVAATPGGFAGDGQPAGQQLLVGADEGTRGVAELTAWFGGESACVPAVVESVRRAYGNDGVEFTIVPEVLSEPEVVTGRCRVCQQPIHGRSCLFCHVLPRKPEVVA